MHWMMPFENPLGRVNTAPLNDAPVKPDRIAHVHALPMVEKAIVAGPPTPDPRMKLKYRTGSATDALKEKSTASGAANWSIGAVADPAGSNDAPERSAVLVNGEFVVAVTVTDPNVPDVLVVQVVSVGV